MRRCLRVLALAALLILPSDPSRGQEVSYEAVISYPPDSTVVEKADIPVEGFVRTPGVDEVTIQVNGDRPRRAVLHDAVFADEVSLEDGANTIRVGRESHRVWLATPKRPAPAGFAKVYGHFGLDEACRECHKVGEGAIFTLAGERDEICTWCHGDLIRGRAGAPWASVHPPVKNGVCLGCHSPHLSRKPGLPAENVTPCSSCHAALYERLKTDRFVHGPMNLGDCGLCHTAHASKEPGLLVRPATKLCIGCHSDAMPPPGAPKELSAHPMIPEGQCARCHEPHSSVNQRMLRQPAGRLCLECHEGKTKSFHEEKGFSIYVCSKCHDLHRPTQAHLIIDASRSLCLECHEFKGAAAFRHSFVSEGKCFICHAFHKAPLAGDVASVCLPCHRDNPRMPAAHQGIPYERARCTVCHRPHESQAPKLLPPVEHTPFAKRECDGCHRDRAGKVGPVYRPLCLSCHKNLDLAARATAPAQLHPPFKDQDCSACHRSHNAEVRGLLRYPATKLCLDCHRKMRKSTLIAPVSAHDAVLDGRCGDCHDPHFSENDVLLRLPMNKICGSCHAAVLRRADGSPWGVGHQPVEEGKCRLCHRHHTATNPRLLKAPMPQPCRPCHGPLFAVIESPTARSVHAPVKEGACATCHRVHGSDQPHLLATAESASCGSCHAEVKGMHHKFTVVELEAKNPGAGAAARGCLFCHLPHASENRRLLRGGDNPVCTSCHKT